MIVKYKYRIYIQADPRIRSFSYPRLTEARKKIWKFKEIYGS